MEIMKIGQKLVSTWTSCGFHVDTTWFPHGHLVDSTLTAHAFDLETMWHLLGSHIVSMW